MVTGRDFGKTATGFFEYQAQLDAQLEAALLTTSNDRF